VAAAQTGTQAIDRAADLLVRVVESEEPLRLGDLALATGLPKSTASRLLRALERHDLVQRSPESGSLRPGAVLVQYARRGSALPDLIGLAQPALDRLGQASGETVNLAVASAGGVEQVAQVDSRYMLGATNWVGLRVPYHASALGKVFLAFGAVPLPDAPFERLTPHTVTTRAELEAQLERVRRRGYATTTEELEPGLMAVAAPVHGSTGAVIAGISISGPTLRVSRAELERLGALLVSEAATVSARLGHRGRLARGGAA
jgi:DNA-binding IclR family transcriptional regulator